MKNNETKQLAMIKDGLDVLGIPSFEGTIYAKDGDTVARVWYALCNPEDQKIMLSALNDFKNQSEDL